MDVVSDGFLWLSVGCIAFLLFPLVQRAWQRLAGGIEQYQLVKATKTAKVFDDLFVEVKPVWMTMLYRVAPIAAALLTFAITRSLLLAFAAAVAAQVVPDFGAKLTRARRKQQFRNQLVDALFMLSSSLRAGLSLTQAFETLESEMGPPASQEFGLMMKAHRVGLSFEESLQGLNHRMACEELNLITTSMLLARATGGDVTRIINQLISTIRERKKLDEKVRSLTLQGRMQAYLMSALPIMFALFVKTFNPEYFDPLLKDPMGPTLMMIAGSLWLVGMIFLIKMSKVDF